MEQDPATGHEQGPLPILALKGGKRVKLGRRRPKARPMALQFSAYLDHAKAAVPPPESVDHASKAMASIKQVLGNNQYGDCVIASTGHGVGIWSGNDLGTPVLSSDQEMVGEYRRICGHLGNDSGCIITEVLDEFRTNGIMVGGKKHTIDGYVAVDNRKKEAVQVAILVFGGGRIGFNVPDEWINNAEDGGVWDIPSRLNFVGGHDVRLIDYNATGVRVATWGMIVTITWRAFADMRIVDECYAELSPDWYNSDKLAPNGIDAETLKADLQKFVGGDLPPWQADPTPPLPPVPPGPIPPLPIPPPMPQTFTIHFPATQVVRSSWFDAGHIPAQDITVTLGSGATAGLPPIFLRLLKLLCRFSPLVPPPYGELLAVLCQLMPENHRVIRDLTIPPWLWPILVDELTLLCKHADQLPPPWNRLATAMCGLIQPQAMQGPCGGC